jgi:uncharacterized protein YecE (DUF72 family)
MPAIHIGTSGWHYDHWRGPFYPDHCSAGHMLDHYVRCFSTVEVNASFYRLPTRSGVTHWVAQTPDDFKFAMKASRYTTHVKRLKDAPESFKKFFAAIEPMGRKLGPVVFQTPPNFPPDTERLDAFLKALPRGYSYAFEFRDPRWFSAQVRALLERHDVALCLYEIGGAASPLWRTAEPVYVRLHGPGKKYSGSYTDAALRGWARRFRDWRRAGHDIWCYFDNDQAGYAPRNALSLQKMLGAAAGAKSTRR